MGLKMDLEKVLNRSVDLVEPSVFANPYFAQVVNKFRPLIYVA
jgi:predicted nucleotidyltransferase